MRGILERIESLNEATYEKDREYRDTAISFYNALIKWSKGKDAWDYLGNRVFKASKFWKHPMAKKLTIAFRSYAQRKRAKRDVSGGSMSLWGNMVVYIPNDGRPFDEQIPRDTIIHEMIHFLDPGIGKGALVKTGSKEYFIHSSEWNAFWQQGADALEDRIGNSSKYAMSIKRVLGNGSWKEFSRKSMLYWNSSFLKNLDEKYKKKFDKRLYQLWEALKKKGVFDDKN